MKLELPKMDFSFLDIKSQQKIQSLPSVIDLPDPDCIPEKYTKNFSVNALLRKAKRYGKEIGCEGLYNTFLLYYALKSDKLTLADKALIYSSLGYLISFIDIIPDLTPLLGFSDDFAILAAAINILSDVIDDQVRLAAKEQANRLLN